MGQLNNEDWEHSDIEAFREAIIGNGVISGLEVTESPIPAMTIAVSAGQCTIDGVVHLEGVSQNLNISNGDATNPRKDIVVYNASATNPTIVVGIPSTAPVPPDIPSGDILLGIIAVAANESTSINNSDITNDRVYSIRRNPYTHITTDITPNDAHSVISINATGGARVVSLPTAVGIRGKVYTIKKTDASSNAVTIDPYSSQTIEGWSTIQLVERWQTVTIQSAGTYWVRLNKDRSNDEIRDAVEGASNSNTFNDADHTKLNGVDTNADVTGNNTPQNHASRHEPNGADDIDGLGATLVASSTSIFSNDTERTTTSQNAVKVKAIIGTMFSGTIRVYWQMHGTAGGYNAYAYVYINGVPVTARQDTSSTTYVPYSFDVNITPGDEIAIYGFGATGHLAYFRYLRIYGTKSALTIQSNDP